MTLTAGARTSGRQAPPLDDIDGPGTAPLRPTRLTVGHVVLGAGFLLAAAIVSILVGPAGLPAGAVLAEVLGRLPLVHLHSGLSATGVVVVWQLRMPRMVLGALVGAMLAIAGASYQGAFSNPYLLGVASGAGLGATLVVAGAPVIGQIPSDLLPVAAFAGAVLAVAATFALGRSRASERSAASLLLAGIAVAAFFTAAQTFLLQRSSPDQLSTVYSWILGGLSTAGWGQVDLVLPYVGAAMVVLVACRRLLDVMSIGDEEATSVGVRAERVRLVVIVAATLGTAAAVSVSGLIGFVGILPLSVLFGAGFLILADLLARTILSPAEIPLGVVTAFLGAPFFLVVLRQARRLG